MIEAKYGHAVADLKNLAIHKFRLNSYHYFIVFFLCLLLLLFPS